MELVVPVRRLEPCLVVHCPGLVLGLLPPRQQEQEQEQEAAVPEQQLELH